MWATYVGPILGGTAALISAIVGISAYRTKKAAEHSSAQMASVTVSVEALQAALARADKERENLAIELDHVKADLAAQELRYAECLDKLMKLIKQVEGA